MRLANCVCINWTRLWEETQDGKYPPSEHAPGCEHYKTEPFTRIGYDGAWCISEPHEAAEMIAEGKADGYEYEVSTVHLTRDQFDNLPDFNGF